MRRRKVNNFICGMERGAAENVENIEGDRFPPRIL
ncbi:hypothetical protein GCK32_001637 [Trichostrongylus colubriformis]|uniref:Uncharacterized protein n=1 Tax=Trichostrongylus colubriformis TaxID=6319 RepID=A0AAN8FZN0_TRICO